MSKQGDERRHQEDEQRVTDGTGQHPRSERTSGSRRSWIQRGTCSVAAAGQRATISTGVLCGPPAGRRRRRGRRRLVRRSALRRGLAGPRPVSRSPDAAPERLPRPPSPGQAGAAALSGAAPHAADGRPAAWPWPCGPDPRLHPGRQGRTQTTAPPLPEGPPALGAAGEARSSPAEQGGLCSTCPSSRT